MQRTLPFWRLGVSLATWLILGSIPIRAAEPSAPPAQTVERELQVGTETRTYRLHYAPMESGQQPLPLVIVLHGMGGTGRVSERLTGFSELADQHNFVACYPDGVHKIWRYVGTEDVDFIRELIDTLVEEKIADQRRVYVTGISNGAYMTNFLACKLSDRVCAVAPVAGTLLRWQSGQAASGRPIPMLYIHGTDDKIVGFDGVDLFSKRRFSIGAEDFVRAWAERNGAGDEPQTEQLPDAVEDETTVERLTYDQNDKAPVIFYRIQGGGHNWPGGSRGQPERILGHVCRDINASELIWEFFEKHELPDSEKD